MTTLLLLLVFPLGWPLVAKLIWKHELTLGEIAVNVLLGVVITVGGWYAGKFSQTIDVEVLNGSLVAKEAERVSCSHSYSCNCKEVCSGSGSSKSCSTSCDTCYSHDWDQDWNLHTTLGKIKVSRVDQRGISEPPRFAIAQVGDPVALTRMYNNYIKGAPGSLFNTEPEKAALTRFHDVLPEYPDDVYDYHYLDRVLSLGVSLPESRQWNLDLAHKLKTLGPEKAVNVVIVFTKETDLAFAHALRMAWLGGKKNDVVVLVSTPTYPNIEWVQIISWTDKELFKVQLRDALQDLKTIDRKQVLDTIDFHIRKGFVRKPMEDFKYLEVLIEPPAWAIALILLGSAGISIWASILFSKNYRRTRFRY